MGFADFPSSSRSLPKLKSTLDSLHLRPSWQQTTPEPEVIQAALPSIRKILERRS